VATSLITIYIIYYYLIVVGGSVNSQNPPAPPATGRRRGPLTGSAERAPWTITVAPCTLLAMDELIFEVTQEADGGFVAECLTEPIFAQASSWAELREQVRDAVRGYYFDTSVPRHVRLHLVRDELLATA
jgi:hypothetical protein